MDGQKINKKIEEIPKNILILTNLVLLIIILMKIFQIFSPVGIGKIYNTNDPLVRENANSMHSQCSKTNGQNREDCYKEIFAELIKSYNFSFAEQTLYALQDIDPGTKSCHVIAHFLSRRAVEKSPKDWLSLLDSVNVNTCGSGFLHGVLESHLGDNPETKFDGNLANETCNRGDDQYRKRMCMHFMGHFFTVSELDDVHKAVPKCDSVVKELQYDCLNGLFMEHNQKIALEDHGIMELPQYTPEYAKSLEKVCQKYSGIESSACWTEMAEVYAKTFGYDAEKIYDHCYNNGIANKEQGRNCYSKGVVVLATYPYNVGIKEMTNICKFYKDENEYGNCTNNLISSLLYYSPKFTERGVMLCENIDRDKNKCFRELGNQLAKFVPEEKDRLYFCSSAKKEYLNICASVQ